MKVSMDKLNFYLFLECSGPLLIKNIKNNKISASFIVYVPFSQYNLSCAEKLKKHLNLIFSSSNVIFTSLLAIYK